ncbi:hypothetical protein RMSM_01670 [Rhodopirellula maiorica SM1]|uniref:Uncharacterized protein n=1 Tax=Rhodopirellula maiorica SM1 TaxID=1265738 RepID=M5RQ14_9BACT|nr:hypothetical protein RMSM_01670 [Rhodopirellula maiorica SM1]
MKSFRDFRLVLGDFPHGFILPPPARNRQTEVPSCSNLCLRLVPRRFAES